jgi:hypothetical protein
MSDLPVACTLDGATLEVRRQGLLADVAAAARRREELTNGLRLEFEAHTDTLALIGRFIDAERRCCRFLQFQLTVQPDEGPVFLALTGPAGTREFLEALIGQP